MDDLDIKFFPSEQVKNGYMGGGYITSGLLKTRFSVFKNNKGQDGFFVSLPSSKKDDGTWENHVEFKNKDSMQIVANNIKPQISHFLNNKEQVSRVATNIPSEVQIQRNAQEIDMPF